MLTPVLHSVAPGSNLNTENSYSDFGVTYSQHKSIHALS